MKGLTVVFMGAAASLSLIVCQGCVQNRAHFYMTSDYAAPVLSGAASVATPSQRTAFELTADIAESADDAHRPVDVVDTHTSSRLSGPVSVSLLDPLAARRLYSSDTLTRFASDREQNNLSPVPYESRLLAAEIAVSAPADIAGLQLELGIVPRLSIAREGALETQRLGGEVRIGQNFDKRGESGTHSGWYLFAGADGEALVWEPDETGSMSFSNMALRERVTVGDMQAGVSFQRGLGALSLSYIRREVEYRERNLGASEHEDFAGISFTLRH